MYSHLFKGLRIKSYSLVNYQYYEHCKHLSIFLGYLLAYFSDISVHILYICCAFPIYFQYITVFVVLVSFRYTIKRKATTYLKQNDLGRNKTRRNLLILLEKRQKKGRFYQDWLLFYNNICWHYPIILAANASRDFCSSSLTINNREMEQVLI